MSWDGSITSFYVNGKKESESKEPMVFNSSPITIAHPPAYTVDGVIDEVKFWAKALTPGEINTAMKGAAVVAESKLPTMWGCRTVCVKMCKSL